MGALGGKGRGSGAQVLVADGRHPAWRDGAFDRVLVDVPCTGLGALRRRPEARWRKSPADLRELGILQRALLASALAAARPGGVVAYVTCSPVPAETSEVVAAVAGSVPGVQILDAPALLPDVPGLRAAGDGRFAQFWPHRHGTDAIFVALLRRGSAPAGLPGQARQVTYRAPGSPRAPGGACRGSFAVAAPFGLPSILITGRPG